MSAFIFPSPNEYPPYFETYFGKLDPAQDIFQFLEEQKKRVLALLKSWNGEQLSYAYAEGKWTRAELINHIIDTERIFGYRALCIARNEKISLPGYDHDAYVQESFANTKSVEQLIAEYETVRNATLSLFKGFANEALSKIGIANGLEISARAILYIMAGHEVHHLQVLEEKYI